MVSHCKMSKFKSLFNIKKFETFFHVINYDFNFYSGGKIQPKSELNMLEGSSNETFGHLFCDCVGRTFSDAQYEAYKKKWIPIRMKNRIYVSWHNPERDMDCKLIGPQTPCFCGHRFPQ